MGRSAIGLAYLFFLSFIPIAQGQIVFSEVMASNHSDSVDGFGESSDWLELYNVSAAPEDLGNWTLSDDRDDLRKQWLPGIYLEPGAFVRIWASGRSETFRDDQIHANFKLKRGGGSLFLTRAYERKPVSEFHYGDLPQFPNVSVGLAKRFFPVALLPFGAPGRFFLEEAPPSRWNRLEFDDSTWGRGVAPFGFDRQSQPSHAGEIATDLSMLVEANASKAFFRFGFDVAEGLSERRLQLDLRFQEGVVAYLNGVVVARRGVLKGTQWDPRAKRFVIEEGAREVQSLVVEDISEHLNQGPNLLALEIATGEGRAVDLHVSPLLRWIGTAPGAGTETQYLESPTPGGINTPGFAQIAPAPVFSRGDGIYPSGMTLVLNGSDDGGGTIRYTLDGSMPGARSAVYAEPLVIEAGMRVKARCFREGQRASPAASGAYGVMNQGVRRFDSNLPIILLDTMGEKVGAGDYVSAVMQIYEPGESDRANLSGRPSYRGLTGVKHRGSSSLRRPKKTFRLKLWNHLRREVSASLLGLPKDGDWILYGPYDQNQALMNNPLMYEMSRRMGHYAPRTRFAEVFVNERGGAVSMLDYVGLYILIERIERGPGRVDVARPGTGGDALTGGYVFKIDRTGPGEKGFRAAMQDLVMVDPREHRVSARQLAWLQDYMGQLFDALAGPDFANPQTGYAAFVDVDSFIDQRLIQEISWNPDAYSLSTYFTKPRGRPLRAGPAWDFDRALDLDHDIEERKYDAAFMDWCEWPGYNWDKLMMDDPNFRARFRARGREALKGVWRLSEVSRLIDQFAERMAEAQARNHRRWGHLSPRKWRQWLQHLKQLLKVRLTWLQGKFMEPPQAQVRSVGDGSECEVRLTSADPGHEIHYWLGSKHQIDLEEVDSNALEPYQGPFRIRANQSVFAVAREGDIWSDPSNCSCKIASVPLALSEILYKPDGGPELEFIEFQNIGDRPIELDGLRISGGVDFDFASGRVRELEPGELVLVMNNQPEYERVHGKGDFLVAGSYDGRLSNTAAEIRVVGSQGEPVLTVFYNDVWFPETDDEGHSLELKEPSLSPVGTWRDPRAWRVSARAGGTPGRVH